MLGMLVGRRVLITIAVSVFGAALAAPVQASAAPAQAGRDHGHWRHRHELLIPGNLLVSTSVYTPADIEPGVTQLPPGCTAGNCVTATNDGAYPYVFINDLVDGSFGVTAKVLLDELTPWGRRIDTIRVPPDDLVTSFSSKSELALNRSTDGRDVTFMGYAAPVECPRRFQLQYPRRDRPD